MVVKTVIMMLVYVTPFVMLGAGLASNVWQLFGLYLISGLGMAGIGMGVMHDANHGSYSRNRKVNKFLSLTMNLIGAMSGASSTTCCIIPTPTLKGRMRIS